MPKTVEELVAERKNTGNTVYESSLSLYLDRGRDEKCTNFEFSAPVPASCFTKVCFKLEQNLEVAFSIINVPASKIISSNYQFSFCLKGAEDLSGALVSTKQKVEFKKDHISNYIAGEYFSATLMFKIKYVGHPRMRNKRYQPIDYNNPATQFVSSLLTNPALADFKFIVKGKEFKVHKNIMAAASPMLLKMFTIEMTENKEGESKIDHIEPEIFEAMLKFVHCCEIPEVVDRRELYAAAHYFQIESLKAVCEQEVHTSLDIDNAVDIFMWAFPYEELEDLKYDAWDVVKLNVLDNLGKESFETVDLQAMIEVLEKVTSLKKTVNIFSSSQNVE